MDPRVLAIKGELNNRKVELIKIDLEVAKTFATIAEDSRSNATKCLRNRANARKGYDACIHFMETARMTEGEADTVLENLAHLKAALVRLGEEFPR